MKILKLKQKALLGLTVLSLSCFAQDGLDYSGAPAVRYSKLRTKSWPAIPFFQNLNAEKALGVYQGLFTPQSFLEVNSTPAYMPYPMPGLGLGEVFRTTSPNNVNSTWRMFSGTGLASEKFNVTTIAKTSDVSLNALHGNLIMADSLHTITVAQLASLIKEVADLKKKYQS